MTLGILTVSEGVAISINIFRLYKEFEQRRIPNGLQENMDRNLGNRLIWFTAGMIFDIVEVVIGTAAITFSGALLRRILKFIGRFCLVIGAAIE